MKRSLVVSLLIAGLFAVGSAPVIHHGAAIGPAVGPVNPSARIIADGEPPPPPTPPIPPAVLIQRDYQRTPWLTADGEPPPPPSPTPWPVPPSVESF
jgi:hypothetical protein